MQSSFSPLPVGALTLKGSTDCSGNPNYPSGIVGDTYYVTVAGKIGGASGKVVEVGDAYVCKAINAGGTEASVGTSWFVLQSNLTGITAAGLSMIQAANAAAQVTLLGAEVTSNKVTAFSSPTDVQYPSALLVNDQLGVVAASAQQGIDDAATAQADVTNLGDTTSVVLDQDFSNIGTTSVDGTVDDLYVYTVSSRLGTDNKKLFVEGSLVTVSSASATRRIKLVFGGTTIWDSGALTLAVGSSFAIEAWICRISSSSVRCVVRVTTTSASTVPYVTITDVTGLTLTDPQTVRFTGAAAGAGAAANDIVQKSGMVIYYPNSA